MLCDRCGKNQASVYVKQVVNNKETVEHLCQQCAGGIFNIGNLELNKLFSTAGLGEPIFGEALEKVEEKACPLCGTTFAEFQNSGRLGCSDCYRTFAGRLGPMIKRIHGKSQHIGKQKAGVKPKTANVDQEMLTGITAGKTDAAIEAKYYEKLALQKQLEELIAAENFEEAVHVRDSIKALEDEIKNRLKGKTEKRTKAEAKELETRKTEDSGTANTK